MSAAKHTPGPWVPVITAHRVNVFTDEDVSERFIVAQVSLDDDDPTNAVAIADAKLIAAAPALADALETLLERCTDGRREVEPGALEEWADEIRAALRAAGRLP